MAIDSEDLPEESAQLPLRLFVYGTLKRGYRNQHFCTRACDVQPAAVWGRLYHFEAGYPGLELAEQLILGRGSADPLADTRRQHEVRELSFVEPAGDWDLIQGELVSFSDPLRDLPPIDQLERFRPDEDNCFYYRVMVPVSCGGSIVAAWAYRMTEFEEGERIGQEWNG